MQQWEYEVVEIHPVSTSVWLKGKLDSAQVRQVLNDMGAKGWELVSALEVVWGEYKIVLLFKRPKQM
jgi:hypothetical protein